MSLRRSTRAIAVLTIAALVSSLAFPALAGAEIPGKPTGQTTTNPTLPPDAWRQGWGNSLLPQYTISALSGAQGFYYTVTRSPSLIDTSGVGPYNLAVFTPGTSYNQTLDIAGTYAYPPTGGWPTPPSGVADPLEGEWFFNLVFYSHDASEGTTDFSRQFFFAPRIDVTPPAAVENVKVSPDPSVPAATSIVGGSTRATVSWLGKDYDGLSGTAYYNVYVDGELRFSGIEDDGGDGEIQPPLWYSPSWTGPYSVTIEDLTAGAHTFEVTAVDRATNEGPKSAPATFYSDPDAPVVTITSPSGSIINPSQAFSASVTDQGGVGEVKFYLDGILFKTMTAAPYSFTADLSGFALGSHVLAVVAKDKFGRTVTATRNVTLVRPPALSRVSAGPSPFYPIKRDRYRDNWIVTYTVSQPAYMTLRIYDATGALVRTIGASKGAGRSSLTWNGKNSAGKIATGRFTATLTASNANGSSKSGTLITYIRNYQIIRLARNRVRVIPR